MNLSIESKKHIDDILDDRTLGWLYPVLETGQALCKAFMALNDKFFDCKDFLNMVPGHMFSYTINKQLSKQCELPSNPFILTKEVVNNRNGYTIPLLTKEDVTLSIMRSNSRKKIENEIKYLQKKCLKNNELEGQIAMDSVVNIDANYHGVLVYGSQKNWDGIEFADILFFDSTLSEINHEIDLSKKLKVYESFMTDEEKSNTLLNVESIIKDLRMQMED